MFLAKTEMSQATEQRLVRILTDIKKLTELPRAERQAIYSSVEQMRDVLSRWLDQMDGKK